MVDFSDALDKVQKVMDKDTEYQDECDVLLDVEGNPVPDKYASITSDNADYFEQQQDEE
jgi:hypothetical protein|tara:strand:+ start:355 stop:531 length:177 start_codon:yes stop_codon:yes gene_type:complete